MNISVAPGTYVVAVSGGVDSSVLLNMLSKLPDLQLIVAHFDHGIRSESGEDREFVSQLAEKYGLKFVYAEGHLGKDASEAAAREARYNFLYKVKQQHGAKAIITAHHKDDVLETALINLTRGTGRKGLSSLQSTESIIRPLLPYSKSEITAYAKQHGLTWQEDATNATPAYLRNRLRLLLAGASSEQKAKMHDVIGQTADLNREIDQLLEAQLASQPSTEQLNKYWFIMLPHTVAREVMVAWLRRNGINTFDASMIERLVITAKTFRPGRQTDINKGRYLRVEAEYLALASHER